MISKKISYFITLAECLSFTQTAARYEVTQTAVSQFIASLEERIGVRLFDRNRHSVQLTEAGRYYYRHVKSMLTEYDSVLDHVRVIAAGFHGSLKVGVGMYEYQSTETLFSAFLNGHPEIRVDILQYPYSELIEKLRSGELDVIIADSLCESAFSKRELCTRTLFESVNSIVADNVLAERNDHDIVKLLQNECLITNCESDGPSSLQMLNILLQNEFGFVPEKIAQTNSINAQLMLVRARHGIAIVPDFICDAQCQGLARFSLSDNHKVCIKLMYLSDCGNEAADMLFNFNVQ